MNRNLPHNHKSIEQKTGILLINLGTPDDYSYSSVRKYLKEFLSDRRVIEMNPLLWQIILRCLVLPIRPISTAKKYQKIWLSSVNESPLRHYTKLQAIKLNLELQANNMQKYNFVVEYAMRYGKPSIAEKINYLLENKCRKILFLPLYPQYCAATTASVCDEIYRVLKNIRWQPDIRVINGYHDDKIYIQSLVSSLKQYLCTIDFQPQAILSSYHGIPQAYFHKGDPYSCLCHKTNRLFNEELIKNNINIKNHISFQSRFGAQKWLQPYTEEKIHNLRQQGITNLLVVTPGFAADCIETLEEVNIEYKDLFVKLGGKNFATLPCLNDSDISIKLLHHLVMKSTWHN